MPLPALVAAPFVVGLVGFIISGLVWRLLASIAMGIVTASFVNNITTDYLNKSLSLMNSAISPDVAALLGMVGADDCISVICGGITFVSVYKSLKIIFVRT